MRSVTQLSMNTRKSQRNFATLGVTWLQLIQQGYHEYNEHFHY